MVSPLPAQPFRAETDNFTAASRPISDKYIISHGFCLLNRNLVKCTSDFGQQDGPDEIPEELLLQPFLLLASSSLMALNLSLPILALKAQKIEIAKITIGRVQKMILTASCAV